MRELQIGKLLLQVPVFRSALIVGVLAFSQSSIVQGQTNSAVPEQTGPQQGSQVQTNRAQTNQRPRRGGRQPVGPPTLGLEQGTQDFETPDFTLKLVKA